MEALARWRHPRHGLLGAGSFLRDADPDLVAAVDREILAQACREAATASLTAVHVNLATLEAGTVRDVLESTGLEPSRLVLELSERALAGGAGLRARGAARDGRPDRVRRLRHRPPARSRSSASARST